MKQHEETCVHFNGTQHDQCKLGINYWDLAKRSSLARDGWFHRLPCVPHIAGENAAHCERLRLPTEEESIATEAAFEEMFANVEKVRKVIKETHTPAGPWAGVVECPMCGGELRWTYATNNHIHGRCSTDGCLSWME